MLAGQKYMLEPTKACVVGSRVEEEDIREHSTQIVFLSHLAKKRWQVLSNNYQDREHLKVGVQTKPHGSCFGRAIYVSEI